MKESTSITKMGEVIMIIYHSQFCFSIDVLYCIELLYFCYTFNR